MKYLLLVCLSIIFLMYIIAKKEKRIELVKLFVFAIIFYFFGYIIICSIFFCMDNFTVIRAVVTEFLLFFILSVLVYKKFNNNIDIYFDYKNWNLEILTILLVSIFALGSYDCFGMGQDEGVYQQKAINLMYGITEKEQLLEEYEELPNNEYKKYYFDSLMPDLLGFDLNNISDGIPFVNDASQDSSVGVWHGIPVYPAILALAGNIAGMSHMTDIHFIFFILYVCLIKFICNNLGIDKKCTIAAMLLSGLSPEILWVTKSALTEIFLAVIVLSYIYFLTSKDKNNRFYSVIAVCIFSLYHVSIYTMLPMFIMIYWGLYIYENEKKYILYVYYILAGYYIGFWDMIWLQGRYTLKNYVVPMHIIPYSYIIPFITLAVITGAACNFFVSRCGKRIFLKAKQQTFKHIIFLLLLIMLLLSGIKMLRSENIYVYFGSSTWVQYAVLSGFIVLPLVVTKILLGRYNWNRNNGILLAAFMWTVVIYCTFLKSEATYYYYTRYLAPYVAIIILLFLLLYSEKKRICFYILIFGSISIFPQSCLVRSIQDDSRMSWKVIEDVLMNVKKGDCVLLDRDLMFALYFPLKAAGSNVYPIKDSAEETLKYINIEDERVLCLIDNNDYDEEKLYVILYREKFQTSEDFGIMRSKRLGLPTKSSYQQEEKMVTMYQIMKKTVSYNIAPGDALVFSGGWSEVNPSGNTWMEGESGSSLKLYLEKGFDYQITVYIGDIINFEKLLKKYLNVRFYINGEKISSLKYKNDEVLNIEIPNEFICDGPNEFMIEADTWSPSDIGEEDGRKLGISVSRILIKRQ